MVRLTWYKTGFISSADVWIGIIVAVDEIKSILWVILL